ncbi:MAG TPA: YHS domain-containing (seleno)protein [Flavisolibacter sp.]|jgi:YHS domain-containing protein|nr:YHS domain-containing (seleno)protein [Flavisolibacter sp.]
MKEIPVPAAIGQEHTKYVFLKFALLLLCSLFMLTFTAIHAQKYDGKFFNNLNSDGVILDGYDPVAFFTDNKPVKGDAQFQYKYDDAIYYFASQEHLDLFKASPEKYKPQFGGWCAYAVSLGRIAPIDVNTFSIVDGRLVIQHNQRAVSGWNKDVSGNLQKADKYWPQVSSVGGKQIKTDEEKGFLNNTDPDGVILQGYDAVAYFTMNKAVKGDSKYEARYNGATYWFSSEANAGMFKDHPEMFAPQYGAFCGYAMSLNKLRPVDPTIFDVIDGKLILQHTQDAYTQFHKDLPGNIAKADGYWPGQVKKKAGKKVKFDKPAQPAPDNTTN